MQNLCKAPFLKKFITALIPNTIETPWLGLILIHMRREDENLVTLKVKHNITFNNAQIQTSWFFTWITGSASSGLARQRRATEKGLFNVDFLIREYYANLNAEVWKPIQEIQKFRRRPLFQ